jgi:hypothetical protein
VEGSNKLRAEHLHRPSLHQPLCCNVLRTPPFFTPVFGKQSLVHKITKGWRYATIDRASQIRLLRRLSCLVLTPQFGSHIVGMDSSCQPSCGRPTSSDEIGLVCQTSFYEGLGGHISFGPLTVERWLSEPHVSEWRGGWTLAFRNITAFPYYFTHQPFQEAHSLSARKFRAFSIVRWLGSEVLISLAVIHSFPTMLNSQARRYQR